MLDSIGKSCFPRILESDRKLSSGTFEARYCFRADGRKRLGISASVRFAKGAIARNALKRQVRAEFRARRKILPSMDVIVMLRRTLVAHPRTHRDELRFLFDELCRAH
jgi:ribonuclease P protein component